MRPDRLAAARRMFDDFRDHNLVGLGDADGVVRNQNILGDAFVAWHQNIHMVLGDKAPDHSFMRALQHFDNRAFLAAALIETGDTRHRAVAVQHQAHFARAEKQIVSALVGHEKAKTFVMADDPPGDHVHAVDQRVQAAPVFEQLAVALHGAQPPPEGVEVALAFDMQGIGDRLEGQRLAALLENGKNRLAAWYGKFIGARLARRFNPRRSSLHLVGLIRFLR